MRALFSILSAVLLLSSCGPSRHAIHVEMRHPSKSGIELSGKIISVVYVSGEDAQANAVNENMALSFASALEKDYQTGEGSVGLYGVDRKNGNYAQKDSLVSLLMSTGSDLIFLIDTPQFGAKSTASIPVKVLLHCFDGMNKEEKVQTFTGNRVFAASSETEILEEASRAGKLLAESFAPQWKHEQYSIAYYDSIKWYEALERAEQYDWKGAMDVWFEFLDSGDALKRASAAYNIAVACYMLGDFDLASQWIDRSDAENKMPTLSDSLRKRINERKAAR